MRSSLVLIGCGWLALAALAGGCSSNTTSVTLTPLSGIFVQAQELTRERGCGTEDGKLVKYAAVANAVGPLGDGGSGETPGLARGVYDCFADAVFTNLPAGADETAAYRIDVVAFESAEYASQKAAIDELDDTGAVLDLAKFRNLRGTLFQCDALLRLDVLTKAACQPHGRR